MSDITVASTTDSIEDVKAALNTDGGAAEEQQVEEQEQPLEIEGHDTEEVEAGGEGEGEDAELEVAPVARPKTSVQKRIDKLTAKNYQLEEEKEAARKEVSALAARLERLEQAATGQQKKEEVAAPAGKARPVAKDFEDYDKYVDALTDWKLEQKEVTAKAEQQKVVAEQQKARQAETFSEYNKAVSQARGAHEDFDEVVGRDDLLVPMAVQAAIVGLRADGPEVAYALASDEALCGRLSEIAQEDGDAVALVAFGKWMAANFDEPEEKPAPARKMVTGKPAPIKPVGGSATKSNVPLDELDFRDFRRIRDEAERARHRR